MQATISVLINHFIQPSLNVIRNKQQAACKICLAEIVNFDQH